METRKDGHIVWEKVDRSHERDTTLKGEVDEKPNECPSRIRTRATG